jgi:ribosomal protein L31
MNSYCINDATQKLTPSIHVRLRMTQIRVETFSEVINSKIKHMLTLSCLLSELIVVQTVSKSHPFTCK